MLKLRCSVSNSHDNIGTQHCHFGAEPTPTVTACEKMPNLAYKATEDLSFKTRQFNSKMTAILCKCKLTAIHIALFNMPQ